MEKSDEITREFLLCFHPPALVSRFFQSPLLTTNTSEQTSYKLDSYTLPIQSKSSPTTYSYNIYLPIVLMEEPYSTSYYMNTVDPSALYALGQQHGERDRDTPGGQESIVILAFGQPWYQNSTYGVILHTSYQFASVSAIASAVQQFALGYWDNLGSDYESLMTIGVGVNNDGSSHVTYAHGAAWGNLVDSINSLICSYPNDPDPICYQVFVTGANDMELVWNSPTTTRNWVNGFHQSTTQKLYNFGNAQGCAPWYGNCEGDWTQEDVWYISWGVGRAQPLPEIYNTMGANADQWYEISVYSFNRIGNPMNFAGVMTQYAACLQRGGCTGMNNSPNEGYRQLYTKLNSNSNTAQDIRWLTDIQWYGE